MKHDLRCDNCNRKIGEVEVCENLAIQCYKCKLINIFTITKENPTGTDPQRFIQKDEKTVNGHSLFI
jgi:phage FluMu protein Com